MSNLASIQKITDITPMLDADSIELAKVLGWQVVVKKGEFKVGDLVVYIQIDTVCPETEEFEFLRSKKFRVKTIKLRGQISQGLIVPLIGRKWKTVYEGDDVTGWMGITKYSKEPIEEKVKPPKVWYKKWVWLFKQNVLFKFFPFLKSKPSKFPFPSNLISKTDEERIQNIPWVLEKYKGKNFVASEKLDGSSITIIYDKGKYRICSRNWEMNNEDNDWSRVFKATNFSEYIDKLVKYYTTDKVIVQGEFIGKPQANYYKIDKDEIRLFNIIINGKRISQVDLISICEQLDIPHCPLTDLITLNYTMEDLLKLAEAKSLINPKIEREGLVLRAVEPDTNGNHLSFKVISNKFLIKNNE